MTATSTPADTASPPDADTTRAALREVVQLALPLVLASASAPLMHFVAVLLVVAALFRRIAPQQVPQGATAVAFAIGTLAAFWTIERVSGIIA